MTHPGRKAIEELVAGLEPVAWKDLWGELSNSKPFVGPEALYDQGAIDALVDGIESSIRTLQEENDRLKREREWLPIETAPDDGTAILLRLSNGEVFSGWGTKHDDGSRIWRRFHATSADVGWLNATHWMPLPSAPALQSKSTEAGS